MADREATNKLKGLLEARLQPRKFRRFQEHHLLNIVKKGFLSEDDLSEATIDRLQAPPGEEIPLLLIDSILEVFNPQAGDAPYFPENSRALFKTECALKARRL